MRLMKHAACIIFLCFLCHAPWSATAHEVRPAYLELVEITTLQWDVLWKVPARDGKHLDLRVEFPPHCQNSAANARFTGGAYIERWQTQCDVTLYGGMVTIAGLENTRTEVLVRVLRADDTSFMERLTPADTSVTVSAVLSLGQVIFTYLVLGVEHILLGIDHLLFVLALLFLVKSWPRLIGTVTAFTVAHSITLAVSTMEWVRVPMAPVEAVIALSIVFVAVEIIHARQGKTSLAIGKPWIVAFIFGLLHGFGFAGALREIGLPENAIPLALAFFNVGVEIGQLIFIAMVFLSFVCVRFVIQGLALKRVENNWQVAELLAVPVAYLVGTLSVYWVFERTAAFL